MFKNLMYLRLHSKEKYTFATLGENLICARRLIGNWYWVTRFSTKEQ